MLAQCNFRVTMSSRDLDQGFDRERILEWLQSVDLPQPASEPDEESPFDSDELSATQHVPPTQRSLLCLSPLLQGQRRPLPIITHPHQQHTIQPGPSISGPPPITEHATCTTSRTDITFTQSLSHLSSLHTRQKSESPLPEIPTDIELPIFKPQSPVPPGNRTSKQSDSLKHQPTVLIHACPGLGSVTLSGPNMLLSDKSPSSVCLQQSKVNANQQAKVGKRKHVGAEEEEITQFQKLPPSEQVPLLSLPTAFPPVNDELRNRPTTQTQSPDPSSVTAIISSTAVASLAHISTTPAPLQALDEIIHESTTTNDDVTATFTPLRKPALLASHRNEDTFPDRDGREVERERVRGKYTPLTTVELATLSLQVGDILPQLAVYLGVDYEDYEHISSTETSLQRQSMTVLMRWYRSCISDSRQELAHTLNQFGGKYSELSQMLLNCELEECRHSLHDMEHTIPKLSPSPSPAPLSHHSPLPSPPQTSPDTKCHTLTSTSSPSYQQHPSRKLKQRFTFDEGQSSSDILPKFLSTRSLQTLSSDSQQSRLSTAIRKGPVGQRHLSLSEGSSRSTSSSPAGNISSLLFSSHRTPRKSSLQLDEMIQITTSRGKSGCEGSHGIREYTHSRRKGSLQGGEVSWLEDKQGDSSEGGMVRVMRSRGHESHYHHHTSHTSPAPLRLIPAEQSPLIFKPSLQNKRSLSVDSRHVVLPHGEKMINPVSTQGRKEHMKIGPTIIERDSKPRGYGSSGQRQIIKRQDSGIETLASNLSAIP